MKTLSNIILYTLLAVAVVPMFLWIFGVFGQFEHEVDVFGGADVMLTIAAIYLAAAVAVMVILTLMNMGKGRGNSKAGLFVFGGLAILAVVFWFFFAKADVVMGADGKTFSDAFTLKISDTMLYLAYAALGLTVFFLLLGEIRKALK